MSPPTAAFLANNEAWCDLCTRIEEVFAEHLENLLDLEDDNETRARMILWAAMEAVAETCDPVTMEMLLEAVRGGAGLACTGEMLARSSH